MIDYKQMVSDLSKSGHHILKEMTPEKLELAHMAAGISGEAGELQDAIKKHVFYNREIDMENVIEELGDLEFYMEGMRQLLNLTREEVLQANIAKLSVRYAAGKYTNEQAQARADKQ